MKIRIQAANPRWRAILEAAADGDLLFLQEAAYQQTATTTTTTTTFTQNQHEADDDADDDGPLSLFETVICSSGCFALHWVAGSCACPHRARQVIHFIIAQCGVNVNQRAKTTSMGRTALHYAARNGRMETARVLVQQYGANPNASAKSNVTPFQLACWRNQLHIAKWLVHECHVNARQTNDFDCDALHWLALCPPLQEEEDEHHVADDSADAEFLNNNPSNSDTGQDLIPTATWLVEQCGLDCRARQRQGHNALHKVKRT
jgi:Ankyrin repeats (3 copies)